MFISEAFAQAAGPAAAGGDMGSFLIIVPMLAVFYFLVWRPQSRKAKQHKEMVEQLRRGDKVILQSGIFGTITKVVDDKIVQVEIAENVKVRVARNAIGDIVAKTEPVAAEAAEEESK